MQNGRTPLQIATDKGDLMMMEYLMTYSAGYRSTAQSITSNISPIQTLESGDSNRAQFSPFQLSMSLRSPSCFSSVAVAEDSDVEDGDRSLLSEYQSPKSIKKSPFCKQLSPSLPNPTSGFDDPVENYEENDDVASISSNIDLDYDIAISNLQHQSRNRRKIVPRSIRKAASRAISYFAPSYYPKASYTR